MRYTPQLDDAIRRAAATPGGIARIARQLGRTHRAVCKQADRVAPDRYRIGCRRWLPDELRILRLAAEEGIGARGALVRLKTAGYERTERAVGLKINRLGQSRAIDNPDLYSASDLALLMGVSGHTVVSWIDSHGLPATRHHGPKGVRYSLRRKHVRTWLVEHVGLYDPRRLVQSGDFLWFVDLIGTGRRRGP